MSIFLSPQACICVYVFVVGQQDISFIMNRTVVGWKNWWIVPMPNIGLFLCKGNKRTVAMFERAWRAYNVSRD